jgi:hypothetical protein
VQCVRQRRVLWSRCDMNIRRTSGEPCCQVHVSHKPSYTSSTEFNTEHVAGIRVVGPSATQLRVLLNSNDFPVEGSPNEIRMAGHLEDQTSPDTCKLGHDLTFTFHLTSSEKLTRSAPRSLQRQAWEIPKSAILYQDILEQRNHRN